MAVAKVRPQVGLKTVLTVFLACAVLPALAHMTIQSYRDIVGQQLLIEEKGRNIAEKLALLVDRLVAERSYALKVLAVSPLLKTGDLASFHDHAKAALDQEQGSVAVNDIERGILLSTAVPYGEPMPPIPQPEMVASRRAQATGAMDLTGVFTSPFSGLPVTSLVMPTAGTTQVVRMTMRAQWLRREISGMAPKGWVLTILDREDRIITSSGETNERLGAPVSDDTRKLLASADQGWALTSELDGRQRYSSWIRVAGGWTVLASIDEQAVAKLTADNLNTHVQALVTTGLLGLLLALLVGYGLGRPLLLVASAARAYGRGEPIKYTRSRIREIDDVLIAFNTSVCRRAETEATLKESEQRFRALVQATGIATWSCPPSGLFVEAQPDWMAFTGQTAEEMLGAGWTNAVHPDDRDAVATRWADAVAQGAAVIGEHRVRRHDGVWRWVESRAAPIRDQNGTTLEWVGITTDVTERRSTVEQLQRSRETLRIAQTSAGLGLYESDHRSKQIVADERFRELWGFSADEEITLDKLFARTHPEDLAAVRQAVDEATDPCGDGMFRATHRLLPEPDMPVRWIQATARVFFDSGKPIRVVGSLLDLTELKRAEERVATLAQQRKLALTAAKLGWWQYDARSRVASWDDGFSAIFGIAGNNSPIEEIFRRSIHPDDLHRVQAQEMAALGQDPPAEFDIEYRIFRSDGQMRWIHAHGAAAFEGAGGARRIVGLIGTVEDITTRRLAEEQLSKSLDTLQIAKAAAQLGIFDFNPVTGVVEMDNRTREIWGVGPDEPMSYETCMSAIHADDLRNVEKALSQALDPVGSGRLSLTYRIARKSPGDVVWIEATGQTFFEQDNAIRLVGTVRDVTDRKQAETALRQSEELLRSVMDNASVGIATLDPNRQYTFVNPAYVRMLELGQTPGELVGSGPAEVLASVYATQISPGLDRAFAGERVAYELTRLAQDGATPRHYTVVYDPTRDVAGNITGIIVVISDITEQKQAERVLVRSAGLRAVGQLAGGIAHDLGNLLTVISGHLQLAEMKLEGTKALGYIQHALDAVERGGSFNRRLTSLTDQRRGTAVAVDIDTQVELTANLLRRTLGEMVSISLQLSAPACQAVIDPAELESAILNLALNARDAMPEGGTLTLVTRVVPELSITNVQAGAGRQGPFVRIDVEDTGVGMTADELRHCLEPFFTTKSSGKGTGLGLTSVQHIAEAAGGCLDLESAPGRGTRASLYLPLLTGPEAQSVARNPVLKRGNGELVLVVEDDPDVCEVVEKRLRSLGYTVRSASTGRDALGILESDEKVRLLFSDMGLPGAISGLDLAHEIEARALGIPVLFTSAYHMDSRASDAIRVLEKPYSMAQLSEAIHSALHVSVQIIGMPPRSHEGQEPH